MRAGWQLAGWPRSWLGLGPWGASAAPRAVGTEGGAGGVRSREVTGFRPQRGGGGAGVGAAGAGGERVSPGRPLTSRFPFKGLLCSVGMFYDFTQGLA